MTDTITRKDFLLILLGAFQMANQNFSVDQDEQSLLKQMIQAAHVNQKELDGIHQKSEENIHVLVGQLSDDFSKKFFLLVLATVAMADDSIEVEEQVMIDKLSEKLKVGKIKLNVEEYPKYEKKVLSLMATTLEG